MTFGPSHLTAMALTIIVPVVLSVLVRRTKSLRLERLIRWIFAAVISGIWALWYVVAYRKGWLNLSDELPLDLCSWACVVTVITLIRPNQRCYELAYFWVLAGTLQGMLTPDTPFDFPEIRFLVFFIFHGGIIAAVLFLTFGMKMRPYPVSILRAIGWTFFYVGVAGLADWQLGTNYGFLRAKPGHISLFDFMPDWPYYLPVLVGLGILSTLIYYLPFFIADRIRALGK